METVLQGVLVGVLSERGRRLEEEGDSDEGDGADGQVNVAGGRH